MAWRRFRALVGYFTNLRSVAYGDRSIESSGRSPLSAHHHRGSDFDAHLRPAQRKFHLIAQ